MQSFIVMFSFLIKLKIKQLVCFPLRTRGKQITFTALQIFGVFCSLIFF